METGGVALSFAAIIIMGGGGLSQKLFGHFMQINWQIHLPHIGMSNYRVAFLLLPAGFLLALLAAMLMRDSYIPSLTTDAANSMDRSAIS